MKEGHDFSEIIKEERAALPLLSAIYRLRKKVSICIGVSPDSYQGMPSGIPQFAQNRRGFSR
jgi:hypothetical protein